MDKAWKREERTVAKAFNATRVLMKGTDEKGDFLTTAFQTSGAEWAFSFGY